MQITDASRKIVRPRVIEKSSNVSSSGQHRTARRPRLGPQPPDGAN
jgi:hypothetical protein